MRIRALLLAAVAPFLAGRATAVEYALTYLSIPGTIDYIQTDLGSGKESPQTDTASFGAFGLVAVVPIPGAIGPFSPAFEAGFAFPAGDQAFDHHELSVNTGTSTHNSRHDGDFTTWSATAVPLLVAIRYSKPSENVTFGGELGVGVFLVGLSTDRTLTTYDSSDTTAISHVTVRYQNVEISPAVQAMAGLVVPATEEIDLRLYGGLIWLSDVPFTMTEDIHPPALTSGEAADLPGITVGGLGFTLRLALNLSL